jgi:hypothetical protein
VHVPCCAGFHEHVLRALRGEPARGGVEAGAPAGAARQDTGAAREGAAQTAAAPDLA